MAAAQIRTWGLIGHGNIGREIQRQIGQPHVATRLGLQPQPDIIVESSGITHADGQVDTTTPFAEIALPDVLFLAIPSGGDGTLAHTYVSTILAQGKIAVREHRRPFLPQGHDINPVSS